MREELDLSAAVRFADFEARPAVVLKGADGSTSGWVRSPGDGRWREIDPVLFDAPDVSGIRELSKSEFFEIFAIELDGAH